MHEVTSLHRNAGKAAKVDWERVEGLFRIGVQSIREIAKEAGVSDMAIRKKAKALAWERDLSAKVAAQVRSDLVRTEVRAQSHANKVRTEREVVQQAAGTVVEVIRAHRGYLAGVWRIAHELRAELLAVIENREAIEVEIIEATPGNAQARRRYNMLRAVALPANVQTLKDLSVAIKNIISMEREAFGVADDEDGAPPGVDFDRERREEHARNSALADRMREVLARR